MRPYIILLIFLVLIKSVLSQAKWEMILPPSPTSNQLVSLDFIDETTGWAVGEYGTILKTTDGGETWRLIEIPQLDYLTDVYFPTASVGYIVGKDGIILKSTDGGEGWFPQTIRFSNNLHRVRFRDESNGWVIGEKGLILHTSDGGTIWEQQVSNSREHLYGLALVPDTNTVVVVGNDSTILVTNNEGQSWEHRSFESLKTGNRYYRFKDVFFLNTSKGWIGGSKGTGTLLLSSNNGGQNWFEQDFYDSRYDGFLDHGTGNLEEIQQIYFLDRRYGFCLPSQYSSRANIPFYSKTNGHYWYSVITGILESFQKPGQLAYLSDNRIICTGYRGEFRISNDKGISWGFPNQTSRNFTNLYIANQGHLLAQQVVAEQTYKWARSDNYGKSWQLFTPQFYDQKGNPQDEVSYYRLGNFFNNGKTSRIICDRYYNIDTCSVYESRDYGRTWHLVHTQASNFFIYPQFLSADTLIQYEMYKVEVSPDNYKFALDFTYSVDAGRTAHENRFMEIWNEIKPYKRGDPAKFVSKSYFFNGHTGFLVGSEGNIIKTTNTGQSWRNIPSGVVEDLWDITFVNRQTGFVVGHFGRILKTEDGGQTWRKTDSGTQEDVYSIGFKNEQEGWAGTETGLLHTTDSGETWQRVPMRYIHGPIREIEFDKDGTGYAYTHKFYPNEDWDSRPGGYILLLVLKEGGVEVAHPEPVSPYSFALHPNYPNPFNSTTIFRFSLPETEAVTLTIYNIRGQLVRTLVDKSLESGEHEVTWNGVNQVGQAVASGVYVARLRRQGEVKTRKVVVLR